MNTGGDAAERLVRDSLMITEEAVKPVSYTHLDSLARSESSACLKRQVLFFM